MCDKMRGGESVTAGRAYGSREAVTAFWTA